MREDLRTENKSSAASTGGLGVGPHEELMPTMGEHLAHEKRSAHHT